MRRPITFIFNNENEILEPFKKAIASGDKTQINTLFVSMPLEIRELYGEMLVNYALFCAFIGLLSKSSADDIVLEVGIKFNILRRAWNRGDESLANYFKEKILALRPEIQPETLSDYHNAVLPKKMDPAELNLKNIANRILKNGLLFLVYFTPRSETKVIEWLVQALKPFLNIQKYNNPDHLHGHLRTASKSNLNFPIRYSPGKNLEQLRVDEQLCVDIDPNLTDEEAVARIKGFITPKLKEEKLYTNRPALTLMWMKGPNADAPSAFKAIPTDTIKIIADHASMVKP